MNQKSENLLQRLDFQFPASPEIIGALVDIATMLHPEIKLENQRKAQVMLMKNLSAMTLSDLSVLPHDLLAECGLTYANECGQSLLRDCALFVKSTQEHWIDHHPESKAHAVIADIRKNYNLIVKIADELVPQANLEN